MTTQGLERARRRPRRRIATALPALLFALAAACAAPPLPAPDGVVADFDAPRPALVASLLGAAEQRAARGDLEGALRSAERALAANPRSGAAALREAELRAAVAVGAGDASGLAESRAAIQSIVDAHPDEPLPRLARARIAFASGDRAAAENDAKALVEERPEWASPQALLARIVVEEDPRRALALAERAVELTRSDPDALAARARARAGLADDAGAGEDARRALLSRSNPELIGVLARTRLRSGDARGAVRSIQTLLEADRTAELEILLARAEMELGNNDAAEGALVRAKTRAGDDVDAQIDAIEASLDLALAEKRAHVALAEIEAARAVGPDHARLAELAAIAQLELGRLADAAVSARRSIELGPERSSAWFTLARVLEREGTKPPAIERARAALGGREASAHALAGVVAERAGDLPGARAEYEAALRADPELAIAKLGLADQIRSADPARALALAESARAEMGWTAATARTLGVALHAKGRAADAVATFHIGLARTDPGSPESVPLQVALAAALADTGDQDEAQRVVSRLLASGERADPPPPWLASVRELRDKLKDAPPTAPSSD